MFNPGINPNVYAQQYANANGISLSKAKSVLKAKYGDPEPLFNFNSSTSGPQKPGDWDPFGHKSKPDGTKNCSSTKKGPQKPGDYDPVGHKSKPDGTKNCSSTKKGPQKPGDYDPFGHKSKPDGTKNCSSTKKGPQKPGDYDPVGHKSKPDGTKNSSSTRPFGSLNPETYAKQVCLNRYNDTTDAHMKIIRAELKSEYGNPQNPFLAMC